MLNYLLVLKKQLKIGADSYLPLERCIFIWTKTNGKKTIEIKGDLIFLFSVESWDKDGKYEMQLNGKMGFIFLNVTLAANWISRKQEVL